MYFPYTIHYTNITRRIQQQKSKYHSRAQDDKCKHKIHIQKQKLNKGQKFTVTRLTSTKEFLLKMTEMPCKLVSLQCRGLTCGVSIYPHIEALKVSTGIRYVTVEDSCFGSSRVTVETNCSTTPKSPSSVV